LTWWAGQPEWGMTFWNPIRSTLETPRHLAIEPTTLRHLRLRVEKHIKNTYLKHVQEPVGGVKPVFKC
ncbi:MAG: hypothetical protein NTW21_39370, partial [Verrucomicrobia bacterium]|nr:hypothetical protein [Verrucomicrobiota bacterium]